MAITAANITKAGWFDSETNKIYVQSINIVIEVSRTSGVSPCTVIFSCKNTTIVGYNEHEVLGTGGTKNVGYYFDFDDPTSGNFNTFHGTSKNISVGGFMAAHTFEVADGGGSVDFEVRVRGESDTGASGIASTTITVQAQDDFYTAGNTVAISNTLTPTGWDALGSTRNPPNGYNEYASIAAWAATLTLENIANQRVMLYRGDDFSGEGTISLRSGNHDFHITWFGPEESGTVATESGNTMTFIAPTEGNKNNGIGGGIFDSADGLNSFTVGAEITVTGAPGDNNGTWTVYSKTASLLIVRYRGKVMTTESPNGSTVITEHTLKPEIGNLHIGTKDAGDASLFMDDADLAKAATLFGNDGWCENVYIDGIRSPHVYLGTSSKHITVHKLDADYENAAVVGSGYDPGRIQLGNQAFPIYGNGQLNPDSVPYQQGLYFSECVCIGSTAEIAGSASGTTDGTTANKLVDSTQNFTSTVSVNQKVANTTDGTTTTVSAVDSNTVLSLNSDIMTSGEAYTIGWDNPTTSFSGVNRSHPIWMALIGCTFRKASEMNFRIQGYQNIVLHDCDMLGQHIGGSGGKGRITLRGAGINQVGELTETSRLGDHAQFGADIWEFSSSRWAVAQYIYDSMASIGQSTFSGVDTSNTVETAVEQLHEDVLYVHWTLDENALLIIGNPLQVENVRWVTITSIAGMAGRTISNSNSISRLNSGPDNVLINGVFSSEADYMGPAYLDEGTATTYNLPVPTAPR